MTLKFKTEEEAREFLKQAKAAGAPPKKEKLSVDEFINDRTEEIEITAPPEPESPPLADEQIARILAGVIAATDERAAAEALDEEEQPEPPLMHETVQRPDTRQTVQKMIFLGIGLSAPLAVYAWAWANGLSEEPSILFHVFLLVCIFGVVGPISIVILGGPIVGLLSPLLQRLPDGGQETRYRERTEEEKQAWLYEQSRRKSDAELAPRPQQPELSAEEQYYAHRQRMDSLDRMREDSRRRVQERKEQNAKNWATAAAFVAGSTWLINKDK